MAELLLSGETDTGYVWAVRFTLCLWSGEEPRKLGEARTLIQGGIITFCNPYVTPLGDCGSSVLSESQVRQESQGWK